MQTYTYQQALDASLNYFNGDELASRVFCDKYALRNNNDEILEDIPEKMHWRIANELARIESKKFNKPLSNQDIFNYLDKFKKIIMQGSPMFGIGNPYHFVTLSNCYVLETPLDSYGGIHKTDEQLSQISKRRGGCGIDISHIRPTNTVVNNSSRTSTGIVPFMRRFSNSIREVGQGGRRGALMITISVHHPQILDFASIKRDKNEVTGANISIKLTDEFLNAVDKDLEYEQRWPVDSKNPKISIKVKAKDVWKKIIENAHNMAEPGLLFWDTIIKESPADCYSNQGFETISTNPCCHAVSKDVFVKTKDGYKEIKKITSNDLIWVTDAFTEKWAKTTGYFKSGISDIYEVEFYSGEKFYITQNHKLAVHGGYGEIFNLVELKDLLPGQLILKDDGEYDSIKSIKYYSTEEVGCINVPDFGFFVTKSGIISGNSELPLSILDSCRLAVINLYNYVENKFTDKAKFNFEQFFNDSKILQRLMDDLVDLELEHIDRIINKIKKDPEPEDIKTRELELWERIKYACKNGRRTGSGITALADTLAALNIKYGSEESIKKVNKIYKTLKLASYWSSVEMAKELGAFPIWNHDLEKNNPFLLRIKDEDEELWKEMKRYGRRNIALLTTAPTGSVSIEAQSSSAIEPLFQIGYTRRKKITHEDKNARIDFVDNVGDKWQEFVIYHPRIKDWMDITGETDVKKSPWFGCCAEDLNWTDRVKLQAAAQKHIDHAISSTLNLPENVSVNKVAEIYEEAWKSGCFRDGNHIYTNNGLKNISDITTNDYVFGHDGELHKVKEVFDLPIENRNFIKFDIIGHEGIESTEEHPFLVAELDENESKMSWKERKKEIKWKIAKDIKINDHLLIPKEFYRTTYYGDSGTIDLKEYISSDHILENSQIWLSRKLAWSKDKIVKVSNSNPIPERIEINNDFCWFLGWFIAEGHFDSESYLRLTLNPQTEQHIAKKCLNFIENTFNIKGYTEIIESNNGKSLRVQFGSKLLCEVFRKLCGQYSENKHLPEFFPYLNDERLSLIIDSHFEGDKGITISKRLARELFMARNLLKQKCHINKNYGEGFEVKLKESSFDTYAKEIENYKAYRVFSINNLVLNEKVYNFSVKNADSYIVNGLITHNCKGITIYRKNCRTGVLVDTEEKKKENIKYNDAPKRPKQIDGKLHFFTVKGEKYYVAVGLLNNKEVYEIFTGFNKDKKQEFIPKEAKEGIIIKNKRGDYIFREKITQEEYQLNNGHSSNEADSLTRILSCALRHGARLDFLIHQLEKTEGDLLSFSKCLARTLKVYIENGTKVTGENCPNCKSSNIVRNSGCSVCQDCGASRCA